MDISIAGMFGNGPRGDLGFIKAFAQAAESLGYRSLVAPEHVVFFGADDSEYPYAWVTESLRFFTGVLILSQRPALLTAKEVLSLDHLSGGRFDLGVGVGWSWEEYGALGVPFERRGKRSLGVDELVLAPLLPTSSFDEGLANYAELAGLSS